MSQDVSSESSIGQRIRHRYDSMPSTTSTAAAAAAAFKLTDEQALGYRMDAQSADDEAATLAADLAFLRTHKQSRAVDEQLQQMYVGLQVNAGCYDESFSLMESMGERNGGDADAEAGCGGEDVVGTSLLAEVGDESTAAAGLVVLVSAASASASFEALRAAIGERAMLFEDDADMPTCRRAF